LAVQVCVDIQATIAQRAGIGRYALRLVQHLAPQADSDRLCLAYFDFKRRGMHCPVPGAVPRPFRLLPGRGMQYAWKTLRWPPFDALFGRADVYHFPNYILPPLRSGRTVATIHDLTHIRFPHFTEDRNRRYLAARIPDTLRRADVLLTDSRCIADELIDTFTLDPARVVPIHLGIDPAPVDDHTAARARLRALGVDRPYLLMVGTLEPRKNIPFLVEVFERLTGFDGLLVLAGMPGWKTGPILDRIRTSARASAIRFLRYVDEALLPALYADAELFIFPSFYEGFGLTPLEAMQAGTAVVSSTGGSLPEVLGDAALFPGPFDVERWAAAVGEALSDSALRSRLVAAGRARAARFTWDATARRTWEVYRSL
jgi:glycosyltransferase involved in cell wall biosynthesis